MKILLLTSESSLLGGPTAARLASSGHDLTLGFLRYAGARVFSLRGLARQLKGSGPAFLAGKVWDQALLAWRRVGSGANRAPLFPAEVAARFNLPSIAAEDFNQPPGLDLLRGQAPDLLLTAGFGSILRREALGSARLDAWNLHPSLLPRFPGANPLRDMIAAGETQAGVTLHRLSLEMDAGTILAQARYPLPPRSGQRRLLMLAAQAGADLVAEAVGLLAEKGSI